MRNSHETAGLNPIIENNRRTVNPEKSKQKNHVSYLNMNRKLAMTGQKRSIVSANPTRRALNAASNNNLFTTVCQSTINGSGLMAK